MAFILVSYHAIAFKEHPPEGLPESEKSRDARQIEDLFLDVRGQIFEPNDLGRAGGGDLAVVGQFALVDRSVMVVG